MSASVGEGARKLGEKLLADVEIEDLSSVLSSLRELELKRAQGDGTTPYASFFGIPDLDVLSAHSTSPVVELVSPPAAHHPSEAGKTSLLYLIIAYAILPASFISSIPLGGQNAAVVLFDPLHHFSVPRLASVMLNLLVTKSDKEINEPMKTDIKSVVTQSLLHLHIFRPQSWSSLLSTLRSLPDYLFDQTRHKSMHRRMHSLILEDVDAFMWSIRSAASTDSTATSNTSLATASTLLTTSLQRLTTLLSCGVILTSQSTTPSSFRPALPTTWPQGMAVTRLAVRRVEVLKFAPTISVEEAEVERAQRWSVVERGRYECWKVGVGVRDGEGFVFNVGKGGVEIQKDGEK